MSDLIAFALVLGLVVSIHEYGHFIVARWCGVGVLKFAVGFGPALFKKTVRGTEYLVGIIPLGGYVRMVGDIPDVLTGPQATDKEVRSEEKIATGRETAEESAELLDSEEVSEEVRAMIADRNQWFIHKSYLQKSLIVFAGPFFNYIFAIVLSVFAALTFGIKEADETLVGQVFSGSPAEEGGLAQGDRILEIQGSAISKFADIEVAIKRSGGTPLDFVVENKDGQQRNVVVTPEVRNDSTQESGKRYMVGISPGLRNADLSTFEAATFGFVSVHTLAYMTVEGLYGLATGKVSTDSLGGPLMIYKASGEAFKSGAESFIRLLIIINISLGLLNLLPIPMLDGGHLLTFLIESVFGPINMRLKESMQALGFCFLISLMLFALYNDISRDMTEVFDPPKPKWESINSEENSEELPAKVEDPEVIISE